jgi:rSAM/selenodomain-associated transferase 2
MISLIIPVLNEEKTVEDFLKHIAALNGEKEIIVADGGSNDNTKALAERQAKVIDSPRGRGRQCNAGARQASGNILFFIHADSCLEQDALLKIGRAVAQGAVWGCLKIRFDDSHIIARLVAWGSNLRVRLFGTVFGDQGIFMTRELYEQVGGFPELSLMEDYQFSINLRARKIAPTQVDSKITSSARRFIAGGRLRVIWRMQHLRVLYRQGVDISLIETMYRDIR